MESELLQLLYPVLLMQVRAHHAVVRSTFTPERHWLFTDTLINYPMGEHGLFCNAEDEGTEAVVIAWLTLLPHTSQTMSISFVSTPGVLPLPPRVTHTVHNLIDLPHRCNDLLQSAIEGFPIIIGTSVQGVDGALNEGTRVLDHVDVHEDKAGLRGGGI